jgi:arylformamidase
VEIIDISAPISSNTPVWPDSPGIRLHWHKRLDAGDECNNTRLDCDTHVGTHVDAPSHFLVNGATVEQLSLDILIGPAIVAYLPQVGAITASDLADLALPPGTKRLLLHTRNSELWAPEITEFREDYVALTSDAAKWIVRQGIRLIGVDYLSVGTYGERVATHRILLEAEVVVVEGLNLYNVDAREYGLICLPLKLVGAEGALARAVLIRRDL